VPEPRGAKPGLIGRTLYRCCLASAALGGAALIGIALMTVTSVIGRTLFSRPIPGDYELVQLSCAVCVAAFLPYCQWQRANIIVDFFTTRASRKLRNRLDALGAVLVALATFIVGWRTGAGALAVKASGETSMLMGVPVWISYALIAPGLILTSMVALYTAWQSLQNGEARE
jgi:TRAP-type C4-dicarboxylate transport system permease small subunit